MLYLYPKGPQKATAGFGNYTSGSTRSNLGTSPAGINCLGSIVHSKGVAQAWVFEKKIFGFYKVLFSFLSLQKFKSKYKYLS